MGDGALAVLKTFLGAHADVFGDLPQQRRGDVPTLVDWQRGAPAASIAELLMGSPLANQLKAQLPEDFRHFPRLENRC